MGIIYLVHIPRTLKKSLLEVANFFQFLLITGPRQVGKTTLLKELDRKDMAYVSLDDLDERALAQNDPKLFLQKYECPVIIDEIQYAPELFSVIKVKVDEEKEVWNVFFNWFTEISFNGKCF